MTRQWLTPELVLLDAAAATGTGKAYPVADWQHIMLTLISASSGNFTIKFQGSFSDTMPDFSAAQSATNCWDYIQVKDYEDNSSIDGDSGVAYAGANDVRMFELNTNGLRWVSATITAWGAGAVTLKLAAFNNY